MKKRITAAVIALAMTIGMSSYAFAEGKAYECYVDSNGVLWSYSGYEYLYVPEASKIGEEAFISNREIKTLDLGDNIRVVGDYAFYDSSIQAVYIGTRPVQIGMYAFAECDDLNEMFIGSDDIIFGGSALANTGYITFLVPCTCNVGKLDKEIYYAKGDRDYNIETVHQFYNDDGTSLDICKRCGEADPDGPYAGLTVPFTDVPESAWYFQSVAIAYNDGILNGKGNNRFDPDANITLAEAAKIAAVMRQTYIDNTSDLPSYGDKWYTPYVDYCYDTGILEDYMSFNWEKKATRGELAYFMSRIYKGLIPDSDKYILNPDVPLTDIPDVYDTTPYAYEILDLYRQGIAVGSDDKYTFYPDSNIKRSEVAAMIVRTDYYEFRKELPKG